METKHTQGPWQAIEEDGGTFFRIRSEDFGGIANLHDPDAKDMGRADELAANARLIAAAPELLQACKFLLMDETDSYCNWCERHADKNKAGEIIAPIHHGDDCPVTIARAAIAKAEGN